MAGDWIKVEHTLPDKPEVVAMAGVLVIDQDAVTGKLLRVWAWADQHSQNGHALSVTDLFIDRLAAVTGFAAAMRSVHWLDGESGNLSFPNFDHHNGETAKARGLANRRQAKLRASGHGDVTKVSRKQRHENSDQRREESSTKVEEAAEVQSTVSVAKAMDDLELAGLLPIALNTPAFMEAWRRYEAYRVTMKLCRLKPVSLGPKFADMATWGEAAAIEAIRLGIVNGWEGLFPPKPGGTNSNNNRKNGPNQRSVTGSNRNVGTLNEGKADQYRDVGK